MYIAADIRRNDIIVGTGTLTTGKTSQLIASHSKTDMTVSYSIAPMLRVNASGENSFCMYSGGDMRLSKFKWGSTR